VSVFLRVSDDVNKAIFLPAFAFLLLDYSAFNFVLSGQQLAIFYVILTGIFIESVRRYNSSVDEELGDILSEDKSMKYLPFVFLSGIPVAVLLITSAFLLLTNISAFNPSNTVTYFLANSILFAVLFFATTLTVWTVYVLWIIDIRKARKNGLREYSKELAE
jgi:hypothetical protein